MLLNRPIDPASEPEDNDGKFISDTQKIIHRHLENEDDLITEEDIRNVRVGMVPPVDQQVTQESADKEFDDLEEELSDEDRPVDSDNTPPITPWEVTKD